MDDIIKEGIRRYLKIYKVSEERKFYQRADVRLKVALPVEYYDETWPLNEHGLITPEKGETLDISNGGVALYSNRVFDVGTVFTFVLPRIGTADDGHCQIAGCRGYLLGQRSPKRPWLQVYFRRAVSLFRHRG